MGMHPWEIEQITRDEERQELARLRKQVGEVERLCVPGPLRERGEPVTDIEYVNHCTVDLIKTNASDLDVCRAAWVSQDPDADGREATEERQRGLISYLWRNHHTSPFEHGSFTFKVHAPLTVAREFMRHRTWSYNEVSGRYTVLRPEFYVPDVSARPLQQTGKVGHYQFELGTPEQRVRVAHSRRKHYSACWDAYATELDMGIAKETARDNLPVSIMTSFFASANPLNVLRFLTLRTDETAMYEIRDVARQIEGHLATAMPLTHDAWQKHGL